MLECNIQALQEGYPDLYKRLQKVEGNKEEQIIELARNGQPTLIIKTDEQPLYIHSRYNPEREAYQWVQALQLKSDMLVVIGMGLGYILPALALSYPNSKIVIVEQSEEVFMATIQHVDISTWLKDERFIFLVGCDPFLTGRLLAEYIWQRNLSPDYLQITGLSVYDRMYPGIIEAVKEQINFQWTELRVQEATYERFSKVWMTTTLRNAQYINQHPSVESVCEKLYGIPVIIVAAGPSLEKNVHILEQIEDRAIILAVGSSVNILEKYGIEPHIIMAIDSAESEKNIFATSSFFSPLLVYAHTLHPDIVHSYPGSKAWVKLKEDRVVEYICKRLNLSYIEAADGPSVANIAFDFAIKQLKASAVILIGQDLAYTNNQTHASGVVHGTSIKVNTSGHLLVQDINGNTVATSSAFIAMKNFYEVYMQYEKPSMPIYNCTEGGLSILGIPNDFLKETIEHVCSSIYPIKKWINEAICASDRVRKEEKIQEKEMWNELLEGAQRLFVLSEKRVGIVDGLSAIHPAFTNEFAKVNDITQQIENDPTYEYMIQPYVQWLIDASSRHIHDATQKTDDIIKTKEKLLEELRKQYKRIHEHIVLFKQTVEGISNGTVSTENRTT